MNENILIINIHSSRNLGDEALLLVTLRQLKTYFPTGNITLSMDDPRSHEGSENVIGSIIGWTHSKSSKGYIQWDYGHLIGLIPSTLFPVISNRLLKRAIFIFTPKQLRPVIEGYIQSDIVLSEPGGFFYSSGRGISLLILIYSLTLAIVANKPIYILPQSIGPFTRRWEEIILRWMLNHVRVVMVREPISLRTVQSIGVNPGRVRLVPDMAFGLPSADKTAGLEWLSENGIDDPDRRPLLGMTVINWGEQDKNFKFQEAYEKACIDAIRWFISNTQGKVILLPQVIGPYTSQDDRVPARRVAEQLPDHIGSIFQIEQPLSLELIRAVYGCMDIFIGTRMHSNIFALSEGVPVIAIGYLHKTKGLAEMIGIDELYIDIHQVNGNALINHLSKLWENRQKWKSHIEQVVPHLMNEADEVIGLVKHDYDQWTKKINNG